MSSDAASTGCSPPCTGTVARQERSPMPSGTSARWPAATGLGCSIATPCPVCRATRNDLAQRFGAQRYHERRASGRKSASPAAVLRGEVRLIAATATRLRPIAAREWGQVSRDTWMELRRRLDRRRYARTLRTRFRRDPDAYLASLEQQACQLTLPT
jgi:hypothetical protein